MNNEKAIKFIKNKNNIVVIGIILIGVIFMTAFSDNGISKKEAYLSESEEQRLEDILSEINGAGKVSVMITYEQKNESDNTFMSFGDTDNVNDIKQKAKGVIVTADGADDARIKRELNEAVSAVLDIEPHKVAVYKRK